jgi:hypothetical protein
MVPLHVLNYCSKAPPKYNIMIAKITVLHIMAWLLFFHRTILEGLFHVNILVKRFSIITNTLEITTAYVTVSERELRFQI